MCYLKGPSEILNLRSNVPLSQVAWENHEDLLKHNITVHSSLMPPLHSLRRLVHAGSPPHSLYAGWDADKRD